MSTQTFPTLAGLGWSVNRTPQFSNVTQAAISGKETRIAYWSYPRYTWALSFDFLRADATNAELQSLMGFFNQRQGSFDSFLFTDPDDNSVTGQEIGTGDATTTNFQLIKTLGGFIEPVLAPNVVTNVKINGVTQSGGSYTVHPWGNTSPGPGYITFTSAPANASIITATFTYYYPVRFVEDTLNFSNFMKALYSAKSVKFISLK